jgi:hypothetical protein
MNLTTLIQKKETLFNNKKFTKALDDIFGGDFNNKATIDEHGRLVIQYKDKNEGCVVFVSNTIADEPYIEARICKTKNPSEGLEFYYQIHTIKTTATLRQFKKFLASVFSIHYDILRMVEINLDIVKEIVKLGRLGNTIK